MAKGDVTMQFDAATGAAVQQILKVYDALQTTAGASKKAGDAFAAAGLDAEKMAEISAKAMKEVKEEAEAMGKAFAESEQRVSIAAKEGAEQMILSLEAEEAAMEEFLAAATQRAVAEVAAERRITEARLAAAEAAGEASARQVIADMESAEALDAFRLKASEMRAEAVADFEATAAAAEEMKGSISGAAGAFGIMTSAAGVSAAAAIAIIDGVNNKLQQTEERAEGLLSRDRSITQALAAAGQQGSQANGESNADYVKGSIDQGSKNIYAGNQVVDVAERTRLFSGISAAVGTKASVAQKIAATENAAQIMAGGADEQTAVNEAVNAILLKTYGAAKTDAAAESMSNDVTPDLGGQISDQQANVLAKFDDDHKQSGVNLLRQAAKGGETGRSLTALINDSNQPISDEEKQRLLVQAGRMIAVGKAVPLDANTAKKAADARDQEDRHEEDAEKDRVADEHREREAKDKAADDAEDQRIAMMKPQQQRKARQEQDIRKKQRDQEEAAADQAENDKWQLHLSTKDSIASLSDEQARKLKLSLLPPGNRLQAMLADPGLAPPELRAQIEELTKQPLPSNPTPAAAASTMAGSEAGKEVIQNNRTAAMVQENKTQEDAEDLRWQAILLAREAIAERLHPKLMNVPSTHFLSRHYAGSEENDAAYAFIKAQGLDKQGITSPDQLSSQQHLQILVDLQNKLGITPGTPLGQPAATPASPPQLQQPPQLPPVPSGEKLVPGQAYRQPDGSVVGAADDWQESSDHKSASSRNTVTGQRNSYKWSDKFHDWENDQGYNANGQRLENTGSNPQASAANDAGTQRIVDALSRQTAALAGAISSLKSSNPSLSNNLVGQA